VININNNRLAAVKILLKLALTTSSSLTKNILLKYLHIILGNYLECFVWTCEFCLINGSSVFGSSEYSVEQRFKITVGTEKYFV
jgi:hypothetical protein